MDRDVAPKRKLTNNELLIKAHFDRTMAGLLPTYLDDAYTRGPWLRKLARFVHSGWNSTYDFKLYDDFIGEWAEYYGNMCRPMHDLESIVLSDKESYEGDDGNGIEEDTDEELADGIEEDSVMDGVVS